MADNEKKIYTPTDGYKRKGIVIALSGPSGVGKGTIISKVLELSCGIKHSVSVTTRKPRKGEKEGVDYYFKNKEEFEKMLSGNEILEYDTYCENYYGTLLAPIKESVEKGVDIIMDITVPGSLSVIEKLPDVVSIFLLPPSYSELKRRLEKRGTEDKKTLEMRLEKASDEIRMARHFEYVLINDDKEKTAQNVLAIVKAENLKYLRQNKIEEKVMKS